MLQATSTPNLKTTLLAIAMFVAALLVAKFGGVRDDAAVGLPSLGANLMETTVSGISSGAYMAGQFQLAHSRVVEGAAIIAGGPYGCAESAFSGLAVGPAATMLNATKAVTGCMQNNLAIWGVPNVNLLAEKAEALARDGLIDPIDGVQSDRVYLFSGQQDRTVVPAIVASAEKFYRALQVPAGNIKFVAELPAGHGFVTEADGAACGKTGEPYVVDCDYDQAKDLLTHLHGPLQPPSPQPAGEYRSFEQSAFASDGSIGLSETGVVYIPTACRAETCRVHIAFHGCAQNRETVGEAFVRDTGFARWADTNHLIVLFPQTRASGSNPQGCWDWWGYTGRGYLTKDAPQIRAVYLMLERLASAR